MPFSRSRSPESRTRSATSSFTLNAPVCQSMASTKVVLPWSTWATMATFRMSSRVFMGLVDPTGRDARPVTAQRPGTIGSGRRHR